MATKSALSLTTAEAVAVLTQLGYTAAKKWPPDKLEELINQINEMDDLDTLMADATPEVKAHFETVMEAIDADRQVRIEDESEEEDADEPDEEEADAESDKEESDEDDDEVEEEPAPKKKPARTDVKPPPVAKPKGKPPTGKGKPGAVPAKGKAAPAPAGKKSDPKNKPAAAKPKDRAAPGTADVLPLPTYRPGETDVWGSKLSTRTSRVNLCLLKGKPLDGKGIMDATGDKAIGSHLSRLARNGKIERKDGKYHLTKQGLKDKEKQDANKGAKPKAPTAKPAADKGKPPAAPAKKSSAKK